jgi:Ran GTPase-activating protein (RanGAP) involved in mRNA processing and transport
MVDDEEAFSGLVELLGTRTWKKVSFNCCSGQGIKALASSSSTSVVFIEILRIHTCQMEFDDFVALGENLQGNTLLTQLEIQEEDMTGSNPQSLAAGLEVCTSLRVLEFSYCRFDTEGVETLARGLSRNQSLESLLLPGCELEDEQITQIIQGGLSSHPSIRNIKIFRNHCGSDGASALAKLLRPPPSPDYKCLALSSLDLSYQQFERAKKLDIGLLASGLSQSLSLITLSLSFNKLNDNDAQSLALGLRSNNVLQELDLRANNIRDAGTVALAEQLVAKTTSLRKLFLFGNPFGETGAQALLKAISGNSDMETLNMDYNTCSYDAIQFYTYLNQAGRRLLKDDRLNLALWPLVLERAQKVSLKSRGVCTDADLLFHLVRGPALSI